MCERFITHHHEQTLTHFIVSKKRIFAQLLCRSRWFEFALSNGSSVHVCSDSLVVTAVHAVSVIFGLQAIGIRLAVWIPMVSGGLPKVGSSKEEELRQLRVLVQVAFEYTYAVACGAHKLVHGNILSRSSLSGT